MTNIGGTPYPGPDDWRYIPSDRAAIAAVAVAHGLVAMVGLDYHGRFKPDLQVGVGRGDLPVADGVLEELRDRIPMRA